MSEIPEDIRETAEKVWQPTSLECKQSIARAVLAERKRCAEVAWQHATECEWTDGVIEARKIAAAIESGQ